MYNIYVYKNCIKKGKKMSFKYEEKYQYLFSICLNVTNSCNLACRYCFVEQHPNFMTLDTAKKAADFIYNNLQKAKEIQAVPPGQKGIITFFGGEPTIMFDQIIVPLIQYVENKYNSEIEFSITTNGTLLNEERIKFLYDHKVGILLSIDGQERTQCYNRPCRNGDNSFKLVEKNIPNLLYYYPNLCFRATIYAETVQYTYENYKYAESLGFKRVFFMPDNRHFWNKEQIQILEDEINKIFNDRLNSILQHKKIPDFNTIRQNHRLAYFMLQEENVYKINESSVIRCGLGTTIGSISYDGTIYGCQEQTSGYNHNNIFIIGNIFNNGIDINKHKKLLESYVNDESVKNIENPERCKECLLKNMCNAQQICPSTSFDLTQHFHNQANIQCLFNETVFFNCLTQLMILTPLAEKDIFINNYITSLFQKK